MKKLLFVLIFVAGVLPAHAQKSRLRCEVVPRLMASFLVSHIAHQKLTDAVKQRAVESYLRRLDPSRTLLLDSEAKQIAANLDEAFDDMERGECGRLERARDFMVARYKLMEARVREILSAPNFAVDETIELMLDPAERGFPRTDDKRRELLRAYVHFQVATNVGTGSELSEAKKQIIHRYELLTQRARQQTDTEIYEQFLDAFAMALDPHSSYLSADDLDDFRISMTLSLEGIGAELSSRDGYITIERIVRGGAADRHGELKAKDKIIAVAQDGKPPVNVIDMPLRDVVRQIRGKKGTIVHLTILRRGDTTERFSVRIERDEIKLEEQAAALRFEKVKRGRKKFKLAILELPSFYGDPDPSQRQAADDVARLLKEAVAARADGLILDLSLNGGGVLDEAVDIVGQFIRTGNVVAVQDLRSDTDILDDPDESIGYSGPLVVLTSRMSASGSEIVAGALQDYQRALIVGDSRTFGKGSVQTLMPLPAGWGALKTTIGLYFLPQGKSTQHAGVAADIVIPSLTDSDEIGESSQPYALPGRSIRPFASSTVQSTRAAQKWQPISQVLSKKLARRSAARVAKSRELGEEKRRLAKLEKNRDRIILSELLREQKDAEARVESRRNRTKDREVALTPQMRETLQILADLVELNTQLVSR